MILYANRLLVNRLREQNTCCDNVPQPEAPNETLLNLLHLDTSVPDHDVGGDTIGAVVEEDNHTLGVHGLTSVEVEVLDVGEDSLLDEGLGLALPLLDRLGGVTTLGHLGADGLEVVYGAESV